MRLLPNGRKIRRLRYLKGLSQGSFARRIGVSQAYICQIELEQKHPGPELAQKIADELGVPLTRIFTLEEDSPSKQATGATA